MAVPKPDVDLRTTSLGADEAANVDEESSVVPQKSQPP